MLEDIFIEVTAMLICRVLYLLMLRRHKIRNAKRWQWITRLINKSETTVMVSCLFPHRSLNILLCLYSCPSSVGYFIVFVFLSVFRRFFCCVLIPVRLPSIPRIILLLTTLLVPSLIVGCCPTYILEKICTNLKFWWFWLTDQSY